MPAASKANLAKVLKVLNGEESDGYTASARTMLAEGLPFAVPPESEKHAFQAKLVGYVEKLLKEVKVSTEKGLAAAHARVDEASAELEQQKAAGEAAKTALDEAAAQVKAKKAAIKELEQQEHQAEADQKAREKEAKSQQEAWKALRKSLAEAEAIAGTLQEPLGQEEGEEKQRGKAAAAVADFVAEQGAEKVLQAGAALALAARPSARGSFDKKVVEAVGALVKRNVADLSGQVAAAEPEEKHLKAEIAGLWAIASVTADAVAAAKEELAGAQQFQVDKDTANAEAKRKIKDQQSVVEEQTGASKKAQKRFLDATEAVAALENLVRPPAPAAAEEPSEAAGETPSKRARTDGAAE